MSHQWAVADRISDRIVNVINDEWEAMRLAGRLDPLQLLAGQLLALLALARTMPSTQPREVEVVMTAATDCLHAMAAGKP